MSLTKTTFQVRPKLVLSSARRLFLNLFRPGYVRASLAQRIGECKRCGACCQLVCRCFFFRDGDRTPSCALYGRCRLPNCSNFPIDRHDLADRDLVSPDVACGYWWAHPDKGEDPSQLIDKNPGAIAH